MTSVAHLHLASVNGEPQPKVWDDRCDSTLLTFTLTKGEVEGAYSGIRNLLWANTRMLEAVEAMRAGDEAKVQESIDFAFAEMISANAFAEKIYALVKRNARRTKPRGRRS